MNDIEKLFKEKLSHHPVAPPPELWDRLEQAHAPRKKKGGWWWLAAASVLLLLLSGLFLVNYRATEPAQPLAVEAPVTENTEAPAVEPVPPTASNTEEVAEPPSEVVSETNEPSSQQRNAVPATLAQKQPTETVKRPEPLAKLEAKSPLKTAAAQPVSPDLPQHDLIAQVQPKENYSLTIIYKSGQAEDQPEAEEQKPLEKAATFLANIKENGVGFSELRSAKSEIISKAFSNKRESMPAE